MICLYLMMQFKKKHANDTFNLSMLGKDLLYDVDSYLAIFKNPTKIKLSDISGKIGSIVGLTASLTDSMGNSKLSGKSINFYIEDELIGSAITDKKGIATFYYKLTQKEGKYNFQHHLMNRWVMTILNQVQI